MTWIFTKCRTRPRSKSATRSPPAGLTTTKTTYDSDGNPVTVTTGTSASLSNLGGLGRATVSALAGNIFGLGGGLGTVIGLPPSSLSLLQSKGKSRLLASTQVHAQDGEQNQTVVGRSVPIRTGTNYLSGTSTTTSTNNNNYSFDNIQYRDVGLVIDVTPTITNEGYVQVKMKLESSNVEATGTDSYLTPTFTKRSLTTISRIQDGVAAVVACVKQDSKGNSRASIPIVGMMPILGRLFSAPKETSSQSDIVITVTPHIIRAPEITPDDHLAHLSGTQQAGATQTIEEVVYRAQTEEDQERRAIARRSTPPAGELRIEAASRVVFPVTPTPSDPVEIQPASLAEEVPAATMRNAPRAEVVPAVRPVASPATPRVPPQKNN
ncbi:MAG: type II and III secretion system protein [Acidobacteriota bacterium]